MKDYLLIFACLALPGLLWIAVVWIANLVLLPLLGLPMVTQ